MAWGKRKGRKGGDSPPKKRGRGNGKGRKQKWTNTPRENEAFMEFYRKMGVIPEEEFEQFKQTLIQDLPTTFRVSPMGGLNDIAQKKLHDFAAEMTGEVEGQKLEPPRPLPWYPNDGAWYIKAARGPLKKHPEFKKFHNFLMAFTEFGSVSRQEAVSMIPPLLLDVQSDHVVLDMCAAPGSKTAQMVEFMHSGAPNGETPKGVIIANDIDEKRCYMMIHQVNRLSSPCVIATQHQAQKFPFVRLNETTGDSDHPDLVFDRILADVPCSGDGTLRKNFDLWGKWNAGMGNGLHKIQVLIATRGIKLLKIGGRMVYSTCSLNPAEDESVVAELLRRGKGSLELVDVSKELPELKRANGVSSWPVCLGGKYYESLESVPEEIKASTNPTLFPPSEEEAKTFHLDRCLRILPHHQDTGGFFVAVIKKTSNIPLFFGESASDKRKRLNKEKNKSTEETVTKEEVISAPTAAEEAATAEKQNELVVPENSGPRGDLRHSKEDPFIFFEGERWDESFNNLKDFYGLADSFPQQLLMIRSEGACPRVYLMSDKARKVLDFPQNKCIRIVNMGLRLFGKHSFNDALCPYRVNSEGLGPLVPFLSEKRAVSLTLSELKIFLTQDHPFFHNFEESTQASFVGMAIGGVWFKVDLTEAGIAAPLLLSGWRGKVSSDLLSNKVEKRLLNFLFIPQPVAEAKEVAEPTTVEESAVKAEPTTAEESAVKAEPATA